MSLISLEEAAKLGLLGDEWMNLFPAVGRSQLFGSPLALTFGQNRTRMGPLERGVGAFGLQHGGSAIQPPRFGLGPLMQGLGLSPSPSAVTAPGAVPVGRAAARSQSVANAATLVARGNPQDIALLARMEEQGLLPPGTFAALLRQGALPANAAILLPAGRREQEGPSEAAEVLGTAKRVLGVAGEAKKFSEGEGTARAITDFLGITESVPTGSFARSPEVEAAFQAYRKGERADVTGGAAVGGTAAPLALSTEIISGVSGGAAPPAGFALEGAQPFQISPEIVSGASGGGAVAGAGASAAPSLAATNEAARQAILSGTTGQAGSLAGAAPLLPLAFAAPAIGMAGSDQERQAAATTAALTAAGSIFGPVGAGVGALAGMALPLLGKLSPHRSPQAKLRAELLEAGRAGDIGRGAGSTLTQATSFEDFFDRLPSLVGSTGVGIGGRAGDPLASPAQFFYNVATNPSSLQVDVAAGVRKPLLGASLTKMGTDIYQTLTRLADQPGALDSLARAEYRAKQRAVTNAAQAEIEALRGEYFRPESMSYLGGEGGGGMSPAIADTAGFEAATAPIRQRLQGQLTEIERQMAADPYAVLPPALRPPSPPPSGPSPSAAAPPPPAAAESEGSLTPTEPLASLRAGGPIPRTGLYRLHAGETVVPAEPRGEDPNAPKAPHWYLPLKPGQPIQAKKNPDPRAYWRLAMSPEDATAAIQSGDPAELPILAPSMVLALPPRKRAAAAEFLRRRQYENPDGTLLDVVQALEPRPAAGPPTRGNGLMFAHHEESETIQDASGRWINVYGRNIPGKAGQSLPLQHEFERPSYGTTEEAVSAAKMRSQMEDQGDFPSHLPARLRPPIYMLPRLDTMTP